MTMIMRMKWKTLENDNSPEADQELEHMMDTCRLLDSLKGLASSISDRLAERQEAAKVGALAAALTQPLATLSDCQKLYEALRSNSTSAKTDDQLATMRGLLPRLHQSLAAALQQPPEDLDELAYICDSMKLLMEERGLVTQASMRKNTDLALKLRQGFLGWKRSLETLKRSESQTQRADLVSAMERFSELDSLVRAGASAFEELESQAKESYEDHG